MTNTMDKLPALLAVSNCVPTILPDGISQLSEANLRSSPECLNDASEPFMTTGYLEAETFDGHQISPDQLDSVSDEGQRTHNTEKNWF